MNGSADSLSLVDEHYRRGLEHIAQGAYFDAHEELEQAWRLAPAAERDFFQGLVHVAVAWYQAGRGNEVGCRRQLEKAVRRLGPYGDVHRDLDVAAVLEQLELARSSSPNLPRLRLHIRSQRR
jgi:predicted metal-dependent hydrolase